MIPGVTGMAGLTVMVTVAVAVTGLAHGSLEVMVTVTTSLFVKLAFVYVLLLVPTFAPFNCHW